MTRSASLATAWLLPALLAASACAPHVQLGVTPEVVSQHWSSEAGPVAAGEPGAPAARADGPHSLGEAFASADLSRLIARAYAANTDLAIAAARIRQARALLGIARGAMLPSVSASAGLTGTRTERTADPFDFSEAFGGLDISFELDLFGARRAERDAARGRFRAAEYDAAATRLAVEADVARAFVQRASLAARIELLDRNLVQARELERIIRVRRDAGEANRVDLGLQTMQVRQLDAERHRLLEALGRTRTALAVLVGEEAPRFAQEPATIASFRIPELAPLQPAELVARRPDVRAAEARIAAAGGDVRAARAAFYPRLRLSASGIGQMASLSSPLTTTFSAGASLLAPIFDRGRLRGNLEGAAARQVESVELYRQTLLTTLAEVENALSSTERARAREALLVEVVEEARLTARLARLQYLEGETDLQRLFDAEQRLIEAEDARVIVLQERLEASIDLFRAMGGLPAVQAPTPVLARR